MQKKLQAAIRRWQEADKATREIQDALERRGRIPSGVVGRSMGELEQARARLVQMFNSTADQSELPKPLVEWLSTYPFEGTDSACKDCWHADNEDKEADHPECAAKIRRFFYARDAMLSL